MAIALFPLVARLAGALGGRRKLAVSIVVLVGLAILLVPVLMIFGSLIDTTMESFDQLEQGTLRVPPPPKNVSEWPLVGEGV